MERRSLLSIPRKRKKTYHIAAARVDGVGKSASTGGIGPADVGLVGLGAEREAGHLTQVRLVPGGALRDLGARLVVGLLGHGLELGICYNECMCGEVIDFMPIFNMFCTVQRGLLVACAFTSPSGAPPSRLLLLTRHAEEDHKEEGGAAEHDCLTKKREESCANAREKYVYRSVVSFRSGVLPAWRCV